MATHQYTRISTQDSGTSSYQREAVSSDSDSSTLVASESRWSTIHQPRKYLRSSTPIIIILTVLSLSLATYQFIRSYSQTNSPPTTSSKEADPLFDFRYTTDLASQDSYRDQQPHTHNRWQTPSGEWLSCGHSPHEAIARNCQFDIMAAVWLPPPCYNAEFAHEMAQATQSNATEISVSPKHSVSMTNMTWHTDQDLSVETFIPFAQLAEYFVAKFDKGEKLIAYSIENFHVAHCLYMMRSALMAMQRVAAGEKDVYVHEQAMGAEHSEHCNDVIMNHETRKTGVTELEFGFGWCHKMS
ncbi:uncharacterized protein Z518_04341 [Rhinocladiella mackenziei CBS 650.93]|uniref:Rhinocladiella mackenziei CBS 650.93 unplaced genomic scaffold supercont1.3, whole genome shotgun sequence n=1 Tax=Rhinocladiella mackenziei CBS 650.93 TaxID=1442369 RepID=A0A0D2JB82_9EURO|nr:uncharacterized protein Z518_04341 [Rhinocladiella mackenziei CBS 650.93]KIX06365.1 hypothetical protein Z518_04341 [Rhinocladiella mackenziei CBS 650.93]